MLARSLYSQGKLDEALSIAEDIFDYYGDSREDYETTEIISALLALITNIYGITGKLIPKKYASSVYFDDLQRMINKSFLFNRKPNLVYTIYLRDVDRFLEKNKLNSSVTNFNLILSAANVCLINNDLQLVSNYIESAKKILNNDSFLKNSKSSNAQILSVIGQTLMLSGKIIDAIQFFEKTINLSNDFLTTSNARFYIMVCKYNSNSGNKKYISEYIDWFYTLSDSKRNCIDPTQLLQAISILTYGNYNGSDQLIYGVCEYILDAVNNKGKKLLNYDRTGVGFLCYSNLFIYLLNKGYSRAIDIGNILRDRLLSGNKNTGRDLAISYIDECAASYYERHCEYDKAITLAKESIEFIEKGKLEDHVGVLTNNHWLLARVYAVQKNNYNDALYHCIKAYELSNKDNERIIFLLGKIFYNIGDLYLAGTLFYESHETAIKNGNIDFANIIYSNQMVLLALPFTYYLREKRENRNKTKSNQKDQCKHT